MTLGELNINPSATNVDGSETLAIENVPSTKYHRMGSIVAQSTHMTRTAHLPRKHESQLPWDAPIEVGSMHACKVATKPDPDATDDPAEQTEAARCILEACSGARKSEASCTGVHSTHDAACAMHAHESNSEAMHATSETASTAASSPAGWQLESATAKSTIAQASETPSGSGARASRHLKALRHHATLPCHTLTSSGGMHATALGMVQRTSVKVKIVPLIDKVQTLVTQSILDPVGKQHRNESSTLQVTSLAHEPSRYQHEARGEYACEAIATESRQLTTATGDDCAGSVVNALRVIPPCVEEHACMTRSAYLPVIGSDACNEQTAKIGFAAMHMKRESSDRVRALTASDQGNTTQRADSHTCMEEVEVWGKVKTESVLIEAEHLTTTPDHSKVGTRGPGIHLPPLPNMLVRPPPSNTVPFMQCLADGALQEPNGNHCSDAKSAALKVGQHAHACNEDSDQNHGSEDHTVTVTQVKGSRPTVTEKELGCSIGNKPLWFAHEPQPNV